MAEHSSRMINARYFLVAVVGVPLKVESASQLVLACSTLLLI